MSRDGQEGRMNNKYHKNRKLDDCEMPRKLDSFSIEPIEWDGDNKVLKTSYFAEYDGWHFEGDSAEEVCNEILEYVFNGGKN